MENPNCKVVFVNPGVDAKKILPMGRKLSGTFEPLGIAYIAAVLEKRGVDVSIIDAYALGMSVNNVKREILRQKPDILGITMSTPSAPFSHKTAQVKKEMDVLVVFGGIHPTALPEDTLKDKNVDIVVRGEGEYTMTDIVEMTEGKKRIRAIQGISYRSNNGVVVHNADRPFVQNLDELPFPARHLLPMEKYTCPPHWFVRNPVFNIMGIRGCPHRCTFCSANMTSGRIPRMRSPENIADEIEHLVNKYGARQINFMDNTFPLTMKHATSLCDELIERRLNREIVWTCQGRVDRIDREILRKMKMSGCRRIAYGVETGVPELMERIHKDITLDQIRNAAKLTKQARIETIALFMIGLPGETRKMTLQTIEFAKEIDMDFAKFSLTIPFPGCELEKELVKQGKTIRRDWSDFSSMAGFGSAELPYVPDGRTEEELKKMQRYAYVQYYLRPKKILERLFSIRNVNDIKRNLDVLMALVSGGGA